MLGGGGEVDEGELIRGLNDEKLAVYLALDSQSRIRYALASEQEALVKVFKAATIEVAQGQSKLLRAFNRNDEAAALEASAALAAADCDTACVERGYRALRLKAPQSSLASSPTSKSGDDRAGQGQLQQGLG